MFPLHAVKYLFLNSLNVSGTSINNIPANISGVICQLRSFFKARKIMKVSTSSFRRFFRFQSDSSNVTDKYIFLPFQFSCIKHDFSFVSASKNFQSLKQSFGNSFSRLSPFSFPSSSTQ